MIAISRYCLRVVDPPNCKRSGGTTMPRRRLALDEVDQPVCGIISDAFDRVNDGVDG